MIARKHETLMYLVKIQNRLGLVQFISNSNIFITYQHLSVMTIKKSKIMKCVAIVQ
jgi:hypothetical protein